MMRIATIFVRHGKYGISSSSITNFIYSTMLTAVVLLLLACFAQQSLALPSNIFFPRQSYTGILWRGNDLMVFNSTEGYEMRVTYDANTYVQYCETERNETSDLALFSFYVRRLGVTEDTYSFTGATQIVTGRRNLSETYIPYLLECKNGKVNFLGDVPGQIPIIAGTPSPFLSPQIEDCVNRTRFTRQNVVTDLNCTAPTPAPTFTPAPTVQAVPGNVSAATNTHVSLFVSIVFVVVIALFYL
jgi:hypothetical protein